MKYSGEHVDVRVQLEACLTNKRIVLSVQDHGVGIAPDDLKSIFKRFHRLRHRSLAHMKGTGLGLFIVKSIAQKHGGRAFAESAGEGQGTTVVIELPRSIAEGRRMSRVLVVEDEAHLAQGLRFNLEAEGYCRRGCGRWRSGHRPAFGKRKKPSMSVVLDIMLPGKDGFSVVSELRAAENYVPVLMLTARGRPEDVFKGFASGADDYLAKPFDLSILLARLQGLLRRSAMDARWPPSELNATNVPSNRTSGSVTDFGTIFFSGQDDRLRHAGTALQPTTRFT